MTTIQPSHGHAFFDKEFDLSQRVYGGAESANDFCVALHRDLSFFGDVESYADLASFCQYMLRTRAGCSMVPTVRNILPYGKTDSILML